MGTAIGNEWVTGSTGTAEVDRSRDGSLGRVCKAAPQWGHRSDRPSQSAGMRSRWRQPGHRAWSNRFMTPLPSQSSTATAERR